MKKARKLLIGRVSAIAAMIALQLALVVAIIAGLSEAWTYLYWVLQAASIAAVLWILSKPDNPSYKLAWCIPIALFPVFGGLFYLMFGNRCLNRRLRPRPQTELEGNHTVDRLAGESPLLARQAAYVARVSGFPLYHGGAAEYFPLGEDQWASLLDELAKAERFILMEYFIIQPGRMWDAVLEVLRRKAAEGVEVKLMYDDLGSIRTLPAGYSRQLCEMGIEAAVFNPCRPRLSSVMNYRDHRKITVIDGRVGYCGGINLADEYINAYPKHGHWKDTGVLIRGEAVASLTRMFLSLWEFASGVRLDPARYRAEAAPGGGAADSFVQPFGDAPLDGCNLSENAYMQMINCARRYVYITTPYLILDNEMITALSVAAQSGVDVRIVTPHVADKWFVHMVTQANYAQLTAAGVRIYEYTPGFIHAKMLVCDDEVCMVGTANLDYRSFYLHFECGVLFYRSSMVRRVRRDVDAVLAVSEEISPEKAREISRHRLLLRALLRAFAPLM